MNERKYLIGYYVTHAVELRTTDLNALAEDKLPDNQADILSDVVSFKADCFYD